MLGQRDLIWNGNNLCRKGSARPLLRIERDAAHQQVWRIRLPDNRLSDMANKTWCKDAAASVALAILNHRETTLGAVLGH
jgi:hypothetical protein